MTGKHDLRTPVTRFLRAVAVCGFPLLLLTDRSLSFGVDWTNHAWLVGYHGEAIRSHLRVPEVVNTTDLVGMVDPAFSGQLLYSLLGVLSLVTGTELAIRFAAFVLMLLQYREIRRTTKVLGAPAYLQHAIPILVCWAIYPLTNLYQRSAITEFFAAGLLTCSVCCVLRYPVVAGRGAKNEEGIRFALYFSVAAMSHPVTAMFGAWYCILLLVSGWLVIPGKILSATRLAVVGVAILAVLSPWLYLAVRFRSALDLSHTMTSLLFYEFDSLVVRLSPFPLDPRSLVDGIRNVSTPYLNAQISTPLLLLAVLVAWARWRSSRARRGGQHPSSVEQTAWDRYGWSLCLVGGAIATTALVVSVSPEVAAHTPEIAGTAQFAYRLVTYVNLGLLTCLCGLLVVGARLPPESSYLQHAVTALVSVAAVAVVQQQANGWAISRKDKAIGAEPHLLLKLPVEYYAAGAYSVASAFRPADASPTRPVSLVPSADGRFGEVQSALVRADQPVIIRTNVLAFPWNRVTVDGRVVENDRLRVWERRLATDLGPGTHVVGYRFEPESTWRALRRLSWATLGILLVAALAPAMRRPTTANRANELGPDL